MSQQPPHDPYSRPDGPQYGEQPDRPYGRQPDQEPDQQPGQGYGYGYAGGQPRTNQKAMAALITGITSILLSMCCLGLAGVAAIYLGVKARREIAASGGTQDGAGLAMAGILTGAVGLLATVALIVVLALVLAATSPEFPVDTYSAAAPDPAGW